MPSGARFSVSGVIGGTFTPNQLAGAYQSVDFCFAQAGRLASLADAIGQLVDVCGRHGSPRFVCVRGLSRNNSAEKFRGNFAVFSNGFAF